MIFININMIFFHIYVQLPFFIIQIVKEYNIWIINSVFILRLELSIQFSYCDPVISMEPCKILFEDT